jgi:hypothetical protein
LFGFVLVFRSTRLRVKTIFGVVYNHGTPKLFDGLGSAPLDTMANTNSQCFYHVVFSTKGRENLISPDIEQRIWSYIGGILVNHNMSGIRIGQPLRGYAETNFLLPVG